MDKMVRMEVPKMKKYFHEDGTRKKKSELTVGELTEYNMIRAQRKIADLHNEKYREWLTTKHRQTMKGYHHRWYVLVAKAKDTGAVYGVEIKNQGSYVISNDNVTLLKCPRMQHSDVGRWVVSPDNIMKHLTAIKKKKGSEKFNFFITRAGSKKCPLRIDWSDRRTFRNDSPARLSLLFEVKGS